MKKEAKLINRVPVQRIRLKVATACELPQGGHKDCAAGEEIDAPVWAANFLVTAGKAEAVGE